MKKIDINKPLNNYFNGFNYNNQIVYKEGKYYIKAINPKSGIALSITNITYNIDLYDFFRFGKKSIDNITSLEWQYLNTKGFNIVLGYYFDNDLQRICIEYTLIINLNLKESYNAYESNIINGLMKKFNQKELYSFDLKKCITRI